MAIALALVSCISSATHSARPASDFNVGELHAREVEAGVPVLRGDFPSYACLCANPRPSVHGSWHLSHLSDVKYFSSVLINF